MDKQLSAEALERLDELIEPWFMFSLIWSVGASCNNDGRQKFNHWLRERMEKENLETPLPKEGSVYDYLFDDGGIFSISEEESKDEDEANKKEKIVKIKTVDCIFCLFTHQLYKHYVVSMAKLDVKHTRARYDT